MTFAAQRKQFACSGENYLTNNNYWYKNYSKQWIFNSTEKSGPMMNNPISATQCGRKHSVQFRDWSVSIGGWGVGGSIWEISGCKTSDPLVLQNLV